MWMVNEEESVDNSVNNNNTYHPFVPFFYKITEGFINFLHLDALATHELEKWFALKLLTNHVSLKSQYLH